VVESTLWPQNIENRELTRSSGGWYQVCRRCQCGSISMYYFVV
jgi:lipocalin